MRRVPVIVAAAGLVLSTVTPALGAQASAEAEVPAVQESTWGSYIVVMGADPLIAQYDSDDLDRPDAKRKKRELEDDHDEVLEDARVDRSKKVNDYTVAANGFSAVMSHEEALRVARQPDVLKVLPDELRQLETDRSGEFLGLTDTGGAWASDLTGEDVVVGVIDSGIWPEHPSFADDGTYTPQLQLKDVTGPFGSTIEACDFGDTAHNPADEPFECNGKLIGARRVMPTYDLFVRNGLIPADVYMTARDDDGHGTHTASTAAGNADVKASALGSDRGYVSGVAPRAQVVAYRGLGELGGFGSDLAAAIDLAVADGVDVINYSVGGGASLIGEDDLAYLYAQQAGVWVATSAGNDGPGADTVGGPGSVPWLTTVGASTTDRTFEGAVVLGDGTEIRGASFTGGLESTPMVDAADVGNPLCLVGQFPAGAVSDKLVLCNRGATARVEKSLAVSLAGGAGVVLANQNDAQALITDSHHLPSVHVTYSQGRSVASYIASAGESATGEILGGVYTETEGSVMADFSSRGPNGVASDIIKPDITAPGVNILAGQTPTPTSGASGQLFQSISGTSMSSPHVAGLYALMKQANPEWSPAMAKSALMTTARQDVEKEDGATAADPFDMGAGHADPSGPTGRLGSLFNPGLVYDADTLDYYGFLCGAAPDYFADAATTCGELDAIGVPTDPSDLNLPSIGIGELAGRQTVIRSVTNVSDDELELEADVSGLRGIKAKVSPDELELEPGESAAFTVTFEVSKGSRAPSFDTWQFGELVWSTEVDDDDDEDDDSDEDDEREEQGLEVRSPIAVRPVAFDAVDAVSATGVDGSLSIDVGFGYAGSYSATTSGFASRVRTEDAVQQDADQTFARSDAGAGATVHEFDIQDALLMRLALPEGSTHPDADLDLFLFGPDGELHADSTNGGTDEVIDVTDPADGTWTLYVHGWQTVGASVDYTLSSWILQLADQGGTLELDRAPSKATWGSTDTVDVSWNGLAPDDVHFGAVVHRDAQRVLGVTLVEVES